MSTALRPLPLSYDKDNKPILFLFLFLVLFSLHVDTCSCRRNSTPIFCWRLVGRLPVVNMTERCLFSMVWNKFVGPTTPGNNNPTIAPSSSSIKFGIVARRRLGTKDPKETTATTQNPHSSSSSVQGALCAVCSLSLVQRSAHLAASRLTVPLSSGSTITFHIMLHTLHVSQEAVSPRELALMRCIRTPINVTTIRFQMLVAVLPAGSVRLLWAQKGQNKKIFSRPQCLFSIFKTVHPSREAEVGDVNGEMKVRVLGRLLT